MVGIFIGDTAPSKIYVGGSEVASVWAGDTKVRPSIINWATQGPCPDGFHVPLQTERVNLYNIFTAIGLSGGPNWRIYFKMPYAGTRQYYSSTAPVGAQGSFGYYWASTRYDNSNANCIFFRDRNNEIIVTNQYATSTGFGYPIRPFKNTPVTPDGSWVALYSNKLYHNSTLGLISLSSDGTTWITIADKNLGATTVYNNGDTLSEANCGKYYQWGNNYGFPRTGNLTGTSSTQVNAPTYGPGNYYSSGTFITTSTWDNPANYNLRGGVDGNVPV